MNHRSIGKVWRVRQFDADKASQLARELGISSILARLLLLRGIRTPEEASAFLNPNLNDLVDPNRFLEMPMATQRLVRALDENQRVLIHGDYDVDGIVSSAMLAEYLRERGMEADVVLPSRFEEGYGLSAEKVKEASAKGYSLLVTVDCGISAAPEIALASSLGMDVIVTDHHEPSSGRPEMALAVINPKLEQSGYPHQSLSGTGVAYKLVEALETELRNLNKNAIDLRQFHDLVALGTIADVVPLLGENRILVHSGLSCLRYTKRPGLRALIEKSGLIQEHIGVWAVAFVLGPRLNAAGRLGSPKAALDLLLTNDYDTALDLAGVLEEINRERKTRETEVRNDCEQMVANDPRAVQEGLILLARPGWPKGVLGIVASRLVEKYGCPSLLLTTENGEAQGSGRSIPGLDLVGCLKECSDLLLSFGGHEGAAGVRLPEQNITLLRDRLTRIARERINPDQLVQTLDIDGELALDDITDSLVAEIELMEPFGEANRSPIFTTRNIELKGKGHIFGNNHLKFVLGTPSRPIELLAFSQGDLLRQLTDEKVDVAYTVGRRRIQGQQRVELLLQGIRPSPSPASKGDQSRARRSVIDWRDRNNRLQDIQRECTKDDASCVFLVDDEDPFRSDLSRWLMAQEQFGDLIETSCFVDACQKVLQQRNCVAISPVWRNEEALVSNLCGTCSDLRIFFLSLPTGEFAGTPRLLDGLSKNQVNLWVYLAFGKEECEKKMKVIAESYPDEATLKKAYRHLQRVSQNGVLNVAHALDEWRRAGFADMSLQAALQIFEELSLTFLVDQGTLVRLADSPEKRSLEESSTYCYARLQRESFEQWSRWLLTSPSPEVARKL